MAEQPVVSVRASAREWVPPDSATLQTTVAAASGSAEQARAEVGETVRSLVEELTGLAGLVLTVGTRRHRLTWSTGSTSTHPEHVPQPPYGEPGPTGRVVASATVTVVVRELDLVEAVVAALHHHPGVQLHGMTWDTDEDNPAWRQVRAAAVGVAVRQARDYAAALGARLGELVHLADTGSFGGGEGFAVAASGSFGDAGPALDPVPQELTATIDARFTVDGVTLDGL